MNLDEFNRKSKKRRKLTAKEREDRKRLRMVQKAQEYQTSTYIRKFVAPLFQQMIRAEWASREDGVEYAVVDGQVRNVRRRKGQCICVTCGKIMLWKSGIAGMHTGHFLASRRNSILFEEDNVAPQCSHCNYHLSGAPQAFRQWMLFVHGEKTVERLERLKTESRTFTRHELVDMRIAYQTRLKAAQERMEQ